MTEGRTKSFIGDSFKLALGTLFGQLLTLACAPVISRLYTPHEFGIFSLYFSLVVLVGTVACLRYEFAIVLPKWNYKAANVFFACVFIALFLNAILLVILSPIRLVVADLFEEQTLEKYYFIIPLAGLVIGNLYAVNFWHTRNRSFGALAWSRVITSFVTNGGQIAIALLGFATFLGLIGNFVLGQFAALILLWLVLIWKGDLRQLSKFKPSISCKLVRRYKKFPFVDAWSALVNVVSANVPIFFLQLFFGSVTVGYFGMSVRVLSAPAALIGRSVSQVFFQQAAVAKSEGNISQLFESTFSALFILAIFPTTMLALFGQEIIAFILGAEWQEAGLYIQILSLWLFFILVGSPISTLPSVLEKQEGYLVFNIGMLVLRIVAISFGGILGDAKLAVLLFAVTSAICWGAFILWLARKAEANILLALRKKATMIIACLVLLVPAATVRVFSQWSGLQITVFASALIVLYFSAFLVSEKTHIVEMIKAKTGNND